VRGSTALINQFRLFLSPAARSTDIAHQICDANVDQGKQHTFRLEADTMACTGVGLGRGPFDVRRVETAKIDKINLGWTSQRQNTIVAQALIQRGASLKAEHVPESNLIQLSARALRESSAR
jgi:hypothetical protein